MKFIFSQQYKKIKDDWKGRNWKSWWGGMGWYITINKNHTILLINSKMPENISYLIYMLPEKR